MLMAPMAEYKDMSMADVLPSLPAPCAPPGMPLSALGSLCDESVIATLRMLARVSHARRVALLLHRVWLGDSCITLVLSSMWCEPWR